MTQISTLNDIKQGLTIVYQNEPCVVTQAKFVRMQQRKPVMQTKLRNLRTGAVIEYNFKAGESVAVADVARQKVQYLYAAGDEYHFMNNDSYEQFSFTRETLGDKTGFLKDGCEIQALLFNNQPISIELPVKMDLKITDTVEGSRGDTAQGKVLKPATVETGLTVLVPLFIKNGDVIRINTEDGKYVQRV